MSSSPAQRTFIWFSHPTLGVPHSLHRTAPHHSRLRQEMKWHLVRTVTSDPTLQCPRLWSPEQNHVQLLVMQSMSSIVLGPCCEHALPGQKHFSVLGKSGFIYAELCRAVYHWVPTMKAFISSITVCSRDLSSWSSRVHRGLKLGVTGASNCLGSPVLERVYLPLLRISSVIWIKEWTTKTLGKTSVKWVTCLTSHKLTSDWFFFLSDIMWEKRKHVDSISFIIWFW